MRSGRRRLSLAWIGTLPFFAYTILFLFLPAGEVMLGAFKSVHGGYTMDNVRQLFHQPYLNAYKTSIEISAVTAVLGGLAGLAVAYAAIRERTPRWIRSVLTTFSGVAANFGGIPLAMAFVATLGTIGIATQFMQNQLHLNVWQGYQLFTKTEGNVTFHSATTTAYPLPRPGEQPAPTPVTLPAGKLYDALGVREVAYRENAQTLAVKDVKLA